MSQKNETTIFVLALLITTGLVSAGAWWFFKRPEASLNRASEAQLGDSTPQPNLPIALKDRLSLGERILVTEDTILEKQEGVRAFEEGNVSTATSKFQASLQLNKNDPEAVIYLNNAAAASHKSLKIATSVPIGSNLNVAKEILRGVAQAQAAINEKGGVNGSWLQILIANDDNDAAIAKQIATKLVNDPDILAVVGHNASNASLAAAPIYQEGKLVMLSPTSFANNLTEAGDYIFRAVPNTRFMADSLSHYVTKKDHKTKIAVCFDSKAPDNQSFRDAFIAAIFVDGGKYINVPCDFSDPTLNPQTVIPQIISAGADGLLLTPHVDRIERAVAIARANQGKLSLYGSPTLYTFKTLQSGQADLSNLVLAVPWHPKAFPNNPFPARATHLWGGDVGWRTASAYDAVQVLVKGLRQSTTRVGLQKALSRTNFSTTGATGTIEFLPSRDRNAKAILVQIQPGRNSGTGYDFVPLSQLNP